MPLHMVYKSEGTLKVSKIYRNMPSMESPTHGIQLKNRLPSASATETKMPPINTMYNVDSEEEYKYSITDMAIKTINVPSKKKRRPILYDYLKEECNYLKFAEFLTECFVLVRYLYFLY